MGIYIQNEWLIINILQNLIISNNASYIVSSQNWIKLFLMNVKFYLH